MSTDTNSIIEAEFVTVSAPATTREVVRPSNEAHEHEPTPQMRAWLESFFAEATPAPLANPHDVFDFVPAGAATPPRHGWRVFGNVVERWERQERPVQGRSPLHIALALQDREQHPVGWRVRRLVLPEHCACHNPRLTLVEGKLRHIAGCGRERESRVVGDLRDHVASLSLAPEDDATFNGYYPTIPGTDVAHVNYGADPHSMEHHQGGVIVRDAVGNPVRGGTEVRGGRSQHRRLTAKMLNVDSGYRKAIDEKKRSREDQHREDIHERVLAEVAKLPRRLGEV